MGAYGPPPGDAGLAVRAWQSKAEIRYLLFGVSGSPAMEASHPFSVSGGVSAPITLCSRAMAPTSTEHIVLKGRIVYASPLVFRLCFQLPLCQVTLNDYVSEGVTGIAPNPFFYILGGFLKIC